MNGNTASGYGAACSQVMSVLDDWETVDVTAMDREDVMRRFVNKRAKQFKPASLAAYKRRFSFALDEFLKYAKDPSAWKPSSQEKPISVRKGKRVAIPKNGNGHQNGEDTPEPELPLAAASTDAGLVTYPFPLREGHFAYLRLPKDLTATDVKRLSAYLNTLVLDASL
jgi:hypothetical protein